VTDGGAGLTRGEWAISPFSEAQGESSQGLAPASEFARGLANSPFIVQDRAAVLHQEKVAHRVSAGKPQLPCCGEEGWAASDNGYQMRFALS
jgi:hypothetical protein